MQSSVLVSSFAEIAREKGIDRDTLQLIVENDAREPDVRRVLSISYGCETTVLLSDSSFVVLGLVAHTPGAKARAREALLTGGRSCPRTSSW